MIERPFLWHVEGPRGPSWLFGTCHLGIGLEELPAVVWDALAAASVLVVETDMGQDPRAGATMDGGLCRRAALAGKLVAALEAWDEHIALMRQAPTDAGVGAREGEAVATYRAGDEARASAFYALWRAPSAAIERILHSRTRAWLSAIEPYVARGGAFIAVGYAHQVGERGLVQLLRDRGHLVARVEAERSTWHPQRSRSCVS